ncbi:MAG: hypothetical protein PVH61_01905 [Candidatus Aminicenantes bacterium]|jgi:hypothetical protein
MKGSKAVKLKNLERLKQGGIKSLHWERVFPAAEFYLFTPGKYVDIYRDFIKVTDIFPVHSVGIVTARDKLTINYTKRGEIGVRTPDEIPGISTDFFKI